MAVKGLQEVLRALGEANKAAQEATAGALYAEGLQILGESVLQVPVDTGRLRQSAHVSPPKGVQTSELRVVLGYGTRYALPVHERLEVHHPTGKAKYLEDPVNAAKRGYAERVGERARRMYARGVGFRYVRDSEG